MQILLGYEFKMLRLSVFFVALVNNAIIFKDLINYFFKNLKIRFSVLCFVFLCKITFYDY